MHVTCMFHAIIIDLHEQHNMHVIMLMYMHVSCNMHGFGTFSMHVTCIKCDMHVIITCMLCATAVDHVTIGAGVGMGMGILDHAMCSHAYKMRTYQVRNTCVLYIKLKYLPTYPII